MNPEIKPNSIYTTNETKEILRVSDSTIKRLLKKGILKANKVGGQYRILGKEILRLISPKTERKAVYFYQEMKKKIKTKIKKW
jgi:predicted site-specific integrase-resolvase